MSKLSAFLHPAVTKVEEEIVISKRFLDEQGNPVPFKIHSLTQEENDALIKRATKTVKDRGGQSREKLDNIDYTRRVVVAATDEPDFSATVLCDAYGVKDPLLVPGRMLFPGEYQLLASKIMDLSGFDNAESVEEEAKN